MTIRKRVKHKWHFTLGDFKFNKATYHPNGDRSFNVLYRGDLIGKCIFRWLNLDKGKIGTISIIDYYTNGQTTTSNSLGIVYVMGSKNQFPTKILDAEIFPNKLDMVFKRKVIFEKWPEKIKPIFVRPGVYTMERDETIVGFL